MRRTDRNGDVISKTSTLVNWKKDLAN